MTKETYGVTYDKENRQWVVKKTGSARASKRCATKAEALEYAEKLSEAKGANLRVHKKDIARLADKLFLITNCASGSLFKKQNFPYFFKKVSPSAHPFKIKSIVLYHKNK